MVIVTVAMSNNYISWIANGCIVSWIKEMVYKCTTAVFDC